ncbi:unnamed protein product [Pleuronectes platessa]|uniref:Ig-like domain-containing protein n=1 Tax=Pleuronectes platessa TaxID=8262 RepID=A0A9N7URW9_PLEPL|nr:unnamed protein product [Pleuronectes platessa]
MLEITLQLRRIADTQRVLITENRQTADLRHNRSQNFVSASTIQNASKTRTCSRFFPSSKRRARRQDVKYGDPWSQCPVTEDDSASVEEKSLYGVEGNSTFLECVPRSPQAELRWTSSSKTTEDRLPLSDDHRSLHMKRGFLVQCLELADVGLYTCSSHEHSYSQPPPSCPKPAEPRPQPREDWPGGGALPVFPGSRPPASLPGLRNSWLPQHRSYKDLHMVGSNSLSVDEYCEQLWYRENRRQQKLRTLKLKQESRKARVRRNNPPSLLSSRLQDRDSGQQLL